MKAPLVAGVYNDSPLLGHRLGVKVLRRLPGL